MVDGEGLQDNRGVGGGGRGNGATEDNSGIGGAGGATSLDVR